MPALIAGLTGIETMVVRGVQLTKAQFAFILRQAEKGTTVAEVLRKAGILEGNILSQIWHMDADGEQRGTAFLQGRRRTRHYPALSATRQLAPAAAAGAVFSIATKTKSPPSCPILLSSLYCGSWSDFAITGCNM